MTPNVLDYYRLNYAGRTAYVELSEGRGLSNQPIFGVTVRYGNDQRFDPDPTDMHESRLIAVRYIMSLEREQVQS
jgi:hypothetical protein